MNTSSGYCSEEVAGTSEIYEPAMSTFGIPAHPYPTNHLTTCQLLYYGTITQNHSLVVTTCQIPIKLCYTKNVIHSKWVRGLQAKTLRQEQHGYT